MAFPKTPKPSGKKKATAKLRRDFAYLSFFKEKHFATSDDKTAAPQECIDHYMGNPPYRRAVYDEVANYSVKTFGIADDGYMYETSDFQFFLDISAIDPEP